MNGWMVTDMLNVYDEVFFFFQNLILPFGMKHSNWIFGIYRYKVSWKQEGLPKKKNMTAGSNLFSFPFLRAYHHTHLFTQLYRHQFSHSQW